jgi:protein tyrosine phosphatase (PTP) superfamily phosphohydrolase (DUF442 family)
MQYLNVRRPEMLRSIIRWKMPIFAVRRPSWRTVLRATVPFVITAFAFEALRVIAWTNQHELIPGRVYRTAQLSGSGLKQLVERNGIKTVLNLRGFSPGPEAPWYADETCASHALSISQEDLTFSANRLPPTTELKRLIEILDRTEYPIAIHCKRGADRTGLASAVVLLLYSDAKLDRARRQLWPRYGHFRFGRTAAMDDFFDRYQTWLGSREHAPTLFREWANHHYTPGPASGKLEPLHGTQPFPAIAGEWAAVRVRATNTSAENWELKSGNYAGIHVQFTVQNETGEQLYSGQAGLFRKTVPPGESLELTLSVPPLRVAGMYVVRADLMDATGASVPIRQTGFYQFGADPLMMQIEVK